MTPLLSWESQKLTVEAPDLADGIEINTKIAGSGSPLLLLHGYPQTHMMWHHVAPELAREHTVVATDLRGYGDSARPQGDDHYSKRVMAADQVAVMAALGFDTFAVAGHDRGARVTHRMALDHADRLTRIAVMDIVPTLYVYDNVDKAFSEAYFHWGFLTAPADIPQHMIAADPEFWIRARMNRRPDGVAFDETAMAEYVRCLSSPEAISATCSDYRAASTIDLDHDRIDRAAGNRISVPTLVLWAGHGFVGEHYDVLSVWSQYADDIRGHATRSDHHLPEERPHEVLSAMGEFFG